MPKEAVAVHGITDKFLADKPIFKSVARDLMEFIDDDPLVIHNANFDVGFLNAELDRIGWPIIANSLVDTLVLARSRHPGVSNRLEDLRTRYEIPLIGTKPSALTDASYLAQVYPLLLSNTRLSSAEIAFQQARTLILVAKQRAVRTLSLANLRDLERLPQEIGELSELRSLTLGGMTDFTKIEDVEPLRSLVQLERLNLGKTRVSNLAPIAALKKLTNLNLSETRVVDIGPLSEIQNLTRLNPYRTRVQDLSRLSSSTKLQHIDVRRSKVSDLTPLAHVTSLVPSMATKSSDKGIVFSSDKITDRVVRDMASLPDIERTRQVISYLRKRLELPPLPERGAQVEKMGDVSSSQAFVQRPASFNFVIRGGKIEAEPQRSRPQNSALARDIYAQLKDKLADVRSRLDRSNAPPRVRSSLGRLADALSDQLSDVKPGLLLMRFRSLEADLAAFDSPSGREELSSDAISLLRDLGASTEDLMACFPALAEIEAARMALRLQEADVAVAREQMAGIRRSAAESSLVAESALHALDAGGVELAHTTEVIETQQDDLVLALAIKTRSSIVAQMLLDYRNFAARVISKMATDLGDVATKSWDEAVKAVPKGVGKGVEKATSGLVVGGITLLVASLSGWLSGLAVLVGSFRPLADKASEAKTVPKSASNEDDQLGV